LNLIRIKKELCSRIAAVMSALGQKRTSELARAVAQRSNSGSFTIFAAIRLVNLAPLLLLLFCSGSGLRRPNVAPGVVRLLIGYLFGHRLIIVV
jgi:hypothetical protein